ncbi:nucleoid occlusion factor SlmA [Thioalbus denitrificans]|nr:nucleoid occlusion factor SlmA [Thioalbus denitrificans]
MARPNSSPRRQQILEALAHMLETHPGERITTAALAAEVGVSEAALYRHFPSKARMYEDLIAFIEETVFSRVGIILAEEPEAADRCEKVLSLLLAFSARNPGITRLLTGDALTGETARLRERVAQFFARVETQLKQILREGEMRSGAALPVAVPVAAGLLLAAAEGRLRQFVRSGFERPPTEGWPEQWAVLARGVFSA